ncbi:hypothetical protein B0H16DRAFT_1878705 [Mycena metata]|uniref:Uncharacterized protein n=1 Tax=Mycena metata TaxID=1033252 RepID=A0AAD7NXL6_9AGAR|nr:hypothetical protein B0H16DRAFT_1878705 [Mycena metata]
MGGRILLWLEHGIYRDLGYKRASKSDGYSPTNTTPLSPPLTTNHLITPPKSIHHSTHSTPNHPPHTTFPMESIKPALPINDTGTGPSLSPSLVDAVNHRIAQLEAEEQRTLTRTGQRPFGTVDQATSYDPRLDIKRAARSQQYAVETGKNLHIRPAMAESAQTKYLGVEEKAFGQEIHRAIFLNARMLIHDPDTGMPGIRTGHLYAELHTNPVEPYRRWPLEVPCVSHQDVQAAIRPRFNRREARKWKATHAAHQLTTAVRETPPISVGMLLKPIGLQDILKQNHAPTHYLIHPPNEPPPFDTSRMTTIGTTRESGQIVLEFHAEKRGAESPETCKRPDTPRLPWILTTIRPEMADDSVGHKNIDHDDLVGNNGSGNTESTAAEEPADTESTVARNVDVEMREQTSADEEEIDELFEDPATERGFGVVHDNGNTSEYADALERLEDDEEMEEGEIKEDARPLDSVPIDSSDRTAAAQPMDPRQGDSGDHSPNPDFALTRTRLITRAHYSSSPSAPRSDSSDDFPPYDTLLQSDTTPFLFGDEYAKLRLLHDVYRKHGHHAVVEEIETLMSFRFSKSQVIAHLLYSGMLETTPKLPDSFPSAAANVRLDGRNHTDALGRNLPGNTESRPPGLLRRDTQHRPKTRFSTKNRHGHRSERGSTVDRVIEVRPTLSDEPPSHHVNFRPVVRNEHGNWRFARLPDIVDVYEIHLDHMYQGHPRTTQIT